VGRGRRRRRGRRPPPPPGAGAVPPPPHTRRRARRRRPIRPAAGRHALTAAAASAAGRFCRPPRAPPPPVGGQPWVGRGRAERPHPRRARRPADGRRAGGGWGWPLCPPPATRSPTWRHGRCGHRAATTTPGSGRRSALYVAGAGAAAVAATASRAAQRQGGGGARGGCTSSLVCAVGVGSVCNAGNSYKLRVATPLCVIQPFSQKSHTPTVAKEIQIGLYDPTEADLEHFWNCCSEGFLGVRL